jgi:hypothetical protein
MNIILLILMFNSKIYMPILMIKGGDSNKIKANDYFYYISNDLYQQYLSYFINYMFMPKYYEIFIN